MYSAENLSLLLLSFVTGKSTSSAQGLEIYTKPILQVSLFIFLFKPVCRGARVSNGSSIINDEYMGASVDPLCSYSARTDGEYYHKLCYLMR